MYNYTLNELIRLEEKCRYYLRRLPKGSLHRYGDKNKKKYRLYIDGKRKPIHDKDLIEQLKFKALINDLLPILEKNIAIVKKTEMIKAINPNVLLTEGAIYKDLSPQYFTLLGYEKNPSNQERQETAPKESALRWRTISGIYVRSSHEQQIANLYTRKNIHFIYEQELILRDGTNLHPDFTPYFRSSKGYIYHEHAGMMHKPNYREDYEWRVHTYTSNGFFLNHNVFFTYSEPDGSIDLEKTEWLIDLFVK